MIPKVDLCKQSYKLQELRGRQWELLEEGGLISIKLVAKVKELSIGSKATENIGRRELNCAIRWLFCGTKSENC